MKINGRTLEGPNVVLIVLSRSNGQPDIPFKFQAIIDYEPFNKLVPEVELRYTQKPGGKGEVDLTNPEYKRLVKERLERLSAWSFLTSISVTPGLAWETVDLLKPDTWLGYIDELKKAGISDVEVGQLWVAFNEANGLSDAKLKEARDRFLQQEAAATVQA